jgi:hypothetical protein
MYLRDFPRIILYICLTATAASAQARVHLGVDVGIPLTDTLSSTSNFSVKPSDSFLDRYNSVTKRLLIGPAFRLELEHGWGIEFDALYQRVNYDHAIVSSTVASFSRSFEQTTANRWQFPLLVQYRWNMSKARPFVEVGPSISRITGSRSTITSFTSSPLLSPSNGSSTSTISGGPGGTWAGVTMGGGVDLPFFHGHLRPEFRYSRWFQQNTGSATGQIAGILALYPVAITTLPSGTPAFRPNQDEAVFLLGMTF